MLNSDKDLLCQKTHTQLKRRHVYFLVRVEKGAQRQFGVQFVHLIEKRFDLVVRLDAKNRSNLDDVSELPIKTESGQILPLKELATVSLIDGPNQIQRENAQRRITVGFNVRGADVQTVVGPCN